MTFKLRFAPSPTGYMHLGALRMVLFNMLLAKNQGGEFFIRLDDTDRARLSPDAFKDFMLGLEKLNLKPDEGVTFELTNNKNTYWQVYQKGSESNYIQSERLEIYYEYAQKLIDKKLCYWSFIEPSQKEELQKTKQLTKKAINWYQVSSENVENNESLLFMSVKDGLNNSKKPGLRFKLQRTQEIEIIDLLLGKIKFNLALEEDSYFLKSDGYPTYHLAHLVDDHLMQTSIVIRGQEWVPSLPLNYTSFIDLFNSAPKYMHTPNILGETGNKKMSKRDGNVNVDNYFKDGYLEEAMINYLVFLGWNSGSEKEYYL